MDAELFPDEDAFVLVKVNTADIALVSDGVHGVTPAYSSIEIWACLAKAREACRSAATNCANASPKRTAGSKPLALMLFKKLWSASTSAMFFNKTAAVAEGSLAGAAMPHQLTTTSVV